MATKRPRRAATLDHNAELWAHIEPETSRLLLLSALDAFLARGFHAATTREIAERAGMSPAAVYVHWRAKHDALARVIQYEFGKLPRPQFRQIVEIRDRFEDLMRDELAGGVAAGAFDVEDLEGTTLAVLSLCIDLARWYHPGEGHSSPQAVGDLYAELVIRMLRERS
jgi:AcrR family transcriptional regulator